MTYQNFLRIRLSLVGVFPGLLVFIGKARLSKVCAHNIEELHLHSGKQGRGGKKQSGTAKRSNDPNVSSENWSTVKQSMEMLLKLTVLVNVLQRELKLQCMMIPKC
ncbi:unnamed protein product [Rhizophagus irregularis]|nr:unnamed protein product [Rhizophagus irregularis]CAB5199166.1 unnamed protein product [Rhizophagus irregularis]